VRWADPDLETLDLPTEAVTALLTERTRLVAVTAASNVVGTRPDLRSISDAAHAVGAFLYADGVHATPHFPIDVAQFGADFWTTSAYKWSGPHMAALVADPALLEQLHPDKLDSVADVVPDRFERGTPPFAQQAGLAAAVDHLASLAHPEESSGPRRVRLLASMAAVEAHEEALLARLLDGITTMPHVRRIGRPTRQAPTVWFRVDGYAPEEVARHCARARINVWSGHNYAWELAGLLGIRDTGSAVRAGMSCYTNESDVDRLLQALDDLGRPWS
jgi:selenocysteine lyase/cysteine desulfurase